MKVKNVYIVKIFDAFQWKEYLANGCAYETEKQARKLCDSINKDSLKNSGLIAAFEKLRLMEAE